MCVAKIVFEKFERESPTGPFPRPGLLGFCLKVSYYGLKELLTEGLKVVKILAFCKIAAAKTRGASARTDSLQL